MASQKLIVMVAFIMLLTFVEQTVTYSKCPSKFWTFRPQFRMEDREQGRKGGGRGGERGGGEGKGVGVKESLQFYFQYSREVWPFILR